MTAVTLGSSCHMASAFTRGHVAVVAGIARCGGLAVVYGRQERAPTRAGGVAAIAVICSEWMSAGFTRSGGAIVAAAALIGGLAVIDGREWSPHRGVMAGVA